MVPLVLGTSPYLLSFSSDKFFGSAEVAVFAKGPSLGLGLGFWV